jgi:hypothetical protein
MSGSVSHQVRERVAGDELLIKGNVEERASARPTSRVLTESDAAKYIGLSCAFLRAARAGRGTPGPTYLRVGRSVRYLIDDLDAWLSAHRVA